MATDLTIHSTGSGQCSLTGKEGEGLTVSFSDGTVKEAFLSTKAFFQLVKMKTGGAKAKGTATGTTVTTNGVTHSNTVTTGQTVGGGEHRGTTSPSPKT